MVPKSGLVWIFRVCYGCMGVFLVFEMRLSLSIIQQAIGEWRLGIGQGNIHRTPTVLWTGAWAVARDYRMSIMLWVYGGLFGL
jgi:hypothetical protein